jgi:hypothetical protein
MTRSLDLVELDPTEFLYLGSSHFGTRIGTYGYLIMDNCCHKNLVHYSGTRSVGAGDGNRTRMASLEGWSSTIELHPHVSRRPGKPF